ncbi:SDR family NAD(P)-dependent oxidoreductase [Sorangium sp. So ce1128]
MRISGQRAIITGSTAGIGHAIAQRLAEEGAEVILTGSSQARVDTRPRSTSARRGSSRRTRSSS